MSMLAERKRKQKWSLNPRGKAWAEDGNKFGQKLLEKMGWSQGKGLGAKEDGMTQHIKVAYKNDSQGMGYKETDDQWTVHESKFSELLESLGGADGKNVEIKLTSLEEKSEKSRARVHYKKFTRGKDLSRYSEKDLANIFGKKSLKEAKKAKVEPEIQEQPQKTEETDKNFSNGGLMSDYFKNKIPNFRKHNGHLKKAEDSESESDQRPSFGFGFQSNVNERNSESDGDVRPSFGFGFKETQKTISFVSYVTEDKNSEETTPKKKKHKKKRALEEDTVEETPSKKKKVESQETQDTAEKTKVKKKKDKNKKIVDAAGLSNPAFDPLYSPAKLEKHVLEPIEESLNETLNDTVGQVAEHFEVQVQIVNDSTPVKKKEENAESSLKKKKKRKESCQKEDTSLNCSLNYSEEVKESHEPMDTTEMGSLDKENCTSEVESSGEVKVKDKKKKKKKQKFGEEESCKSSKGIENPLFNVSLEQDNSIGASENPYEVKLKDKKKKKKQKLSKEESCESGKGIENPLFNISLELDNSISNTENPYEVKVKDKRKKKKQKPNKEETSDTSESNKGIDNPLFSVGLEVKNPTSEAENPYEVKAKDKKKRKKTPENIGLDNPALNLNDTLEETCDLMLNVISTPVPVSTPSENSAKKKKIKVVERRKSVRFSDVTRERIIPSKEEIESETLDDSRDIVEVQGKLNDSSDDGPSRGKFIKKKKSKGLENGAFDAKAAEIEENITAIAKTLDNFEAEIENDMNEAKMMKSVEIEDIMVGEVGNPDGTHEKLPDGSVKLKFKYANFKKTARYLDGLTGSKKSYKHLIKGDVVMGFKETNLHEINGYGVANKAS